MATTTVQIETTERADPLSDTRVTKLARLNRLSRLIGAIKGVGTRTAPTVRRGVNFAGGTIILASTDGDTTATINGVAIVGTFATSDTVTATALVTAINASTDGLIQNIVIAGNLKQVFTFSSAVLGGLTVQIGDVLLRTTLKSSGQDSYNDFTVGGTDTADAAAFCACVNAHPVLSEYLWASNSSGVATVIVKGTTFPSRYTNYSVSSSATIAIGAAAFAAGTTVGVFCTRRGIMGNVITLAASTAGAGTATASGARLTLGTDATT